MNQRFQVTMMVFSGFLVVMLSAQALWGREVVDPWVTPGLWVFILIVTAMGYRWDKMSARNLAASQEESARKLAEIRKGPTG